MVSGNPVSCASRSAATRPASKGPVWPHKKGPPRERGARSRGRMARLGLGGKMRARQTNPTSAELFPHQNRPAAESPRGQVKLIAARLAGGFCADHAARCSR
jgi:hypothetical protein